MQLGEDKTTARISKLNELFTDKMYVGLRNGRCVAISREYKANTKENRSVRVEWAKEGLDVLTVSESEMQPYYDDMRAYANERKSERLL